MFKLFDFVKCKHILSAIPIGTRGTIIEIYSKPYTAYEVEFMDENKDYISFTLLPEQIECL